MLAPLQSSSPPRRSPKQLHQLCRTEWLCGTAHAGGDERPHAQGGAGGAGGRGHFSVPSSLAWATTVHPGYTVVLIAIAHGKFLCVTVARLRACRGRLRPRDVHVRAAHHGQDPWRAGLCSEVCQRRAAAHTHRARPRTRYPSSILEASSLCPRRGRQEPRLSSRPSGTRRTAGSAGWNDKPRG